MSFEEDSVYDDYNDPMKLDLNTPWRSRFIRMPSGDGQTGGQFQRQVTEKSDLARSPSQSLDSHVLTRQMTSGRSQTKLIKAEKLLVLKEAAEGLMAKLYMLRKTLDLPSGPIKPTDGAWKAGIFPDAPKLCTYLAKKFPEHPRTLQLEKVDKAAFEVVRGLAEKYRRNLEPWYLVMVDLMKFQELALKLLLDVAKTSVILDPEKNPSMFHAFMELFCSYIKVHMMLEKTGRKLIVQVYAMLHDFAQGGTDPEDHKKLLLFLAAYDSPIRGVQADFIPLSSRIGEILQSVGSVVGELHDIQAFRTDALLSPYTSWEPQQLHPSHADSRDFLHLEAYRQWVLFGYLACPGELMHHRAVHILSEVLQTTYVVPLFRDEVVLIHEEYNSYAFPKSSESGKGSRGSKQRSLDSDVDFQAMKTVKMKLSEAQDIALASMDILHRQRRVMLKQELSRLHLWLSDEPTLLGPNIFIVLPALALARSEVLWYFQHANVVTSNGKRGGGAAQPSLAVDLEIPDPTIGFLIDSIFQLVTLVKRYSSAVRGHATAYLKKATGRIKALLGSPRLEELSLDGGLQLLFASFTTAVDDLMQVMKESEDDVMAGGVPLSWQRFRADWFEISGTMSSVRSSATLHQLEQATMEGMQPSLVSECNVAYMWSRNVDELGDVLRECTTLKTLCFYHHHLVMVFRQTMFGPEGRPQHCPSWMAVAWSFTENAHRSLPEEAERLRKAAIDYADSLLEAIMGGLDFYLGALDSDKGLSGLDSQLEPSQAALLMNRVHAQGQAKAAKRLPDLVLPGHESDPTKTGSASDLEVMVQRLVSLVAALNEMEPMEVEGHAFIPREYMRERLANALRTRIYSALTANGDLVRPIAVETALRRLCTAIHLLEQHTNTDLSRTIREVFMSEAYAGRMRDLHLLDVQIANDGPITESLAEVFLSNVVYDVKGTGVVYAPLQKTFFSGGVSGGGVELLADLPEMESLVRTFGLYGVDKFVLEIREALMGLLNRFEQILRANRGQLSELARNMHSEEARAASLRSMVDLEAAVAVSIQIGHCLNLQTLLAEASAHVLQANTPLVFTTLKCAAKHVPRGAPENGHVAQVRRLASRIGAMERFGDSSPEVLSMLLEIGGVGDAAWALLPHFFAAFVASDVWKGAAFNLAMGGFSNNVHCLVRCIHTLVEGCEITGAERRELKRELLAQQRAARGGGKTGDGYEDEEDAMGQGALDEAIQHMMRDFLQSASCMIFAKWNKSSRGSVFSQIIFLDQLCEMSPYLPRSTFQTYIPHAVVQAAYHAYQREMTGAQPSGLGLEREQGPMAVRQLTKALPGSSQKGTWSKQSSKTSTWGPSTSRENSSPREGSPEAKRKSTPGPLFAAMRGRDRDKEKDSQGQEKKADLLSGNAEKALRGERSAEKGPEEGLSRKPRGGGGSFFSGPLSFSLSRKHSKPKATEGTGQGVGPGGRWLDVEHSKRGRLPGRRPPHPTPSTQSLGSLGSFRSLLSGESGASSREATGRGPPPGYVDVGRYSDRSMASRVGDRWDEGDEISSAQKGLRTLALPKRGADGEDIPGGL